ncbi:MAG TPA: molecular chaperone DnaK, partial [Chloroflexi bacterium]|nr:molecular chaperone DnaK [Chloroflexota bacterium]
RLEGIPPAPRGLPQVEVTFDIDANGILNVSAQDKATGKEQKITITASTNLNQADIDRMVREAQSHAAEDRRLRELVEARNQADSVIYTTERSLRELGDQLSQSDRQQIEQRVEELRQAMQSEDLPRIHNAIEALQQASYALGQQLYQQQQAAGGPGPGPDGGRGGEDEDVVEGEFREA